MKKDKKKSAPNFKNYVEYTKIWRKNEDEKNGTCKVCKSERKLKNNTCYKCYEKKYNRKKNYVKNTIDDKEGNEISKVISGKRKLYFGLIIVGAFSFALAPIIHFMVSENNELKLNVLNEYDEEIISTKVEGKGTVKKADTFVANGDKPNVDDLIIIPPKGSVYLFKEAAPVNSAGESYITIEVKSENDNSSSGQIIFRIFGFETLAERKARELKNIMDLNSKIMEESKSPSGTVTKKTGSKVNNGEHPTIKDLIIKPNKGFTYTYESSTVVDKNGYSIITIRINSNPKIEGIDIKTATFAVGGFETKAEMQNRKRAEKLAEAIKIVKNELAVPKGTVKKSSKSFVKYGESPSISDFILTPPPSIYYRYMVSSNVNENGESTVTIAVMYNPKLRGSGGGFIKIIVSGFETKKQKNTREALALISSIKSQLDNIKGKENIGASSKSKKTAEPFINGQFGITVKGINGAKITYDHPKITKDGDENYIFKISKDGHEDTANVTISISGISTL